MANQSLKAKYYFNVVDGPSKFDLMMALFNNSNDNPRTVSFKLVSPRTQQERMVEISISDVGQEDGSGESWNLKGYIKGSCDWATGSTSNNRVLIYFSTKRRTGTLSAE